MTHLGRKLFIQNGKMPDGSTYIHNEEPVIFFKYTGKSTTMTEKEFYQKVKPCEGDNGYDDAMAIRDKSMR